MTQPSPLVSQPHHQPPTPISAQASYVRSARHIPHATEPHPPQTFPAHAMRGGGTTKISGPGLELPPAAPSGRLEGLPRAAETMGLAMAANSPAMSVEVGGGISAEGCGCGPARIGPAVPQKRPDPGKNATWGIRRIPSLF